MIHRSNVSIVLSFCLLLLRPAQSFAADPLLPVPTASLDLSVSEEPTWVTVAYSSEASIAVGICRYRICSLSLIHWENGSLKKVAENFQLEPGESIHASADGRFVTILTRRPHIIYSADLSTSKEISKTIARISPSGKTVSEWALASWKVYSLTDTLTPVREGMGNLVSLSDEFLVIQNKKTLRIENIDGQFVGSFSLPSEAWGHASLLGRTQLYVDDCSKARVVDFNGNVHLEIHPKSLYSQGSRWSTDASVCNQGENSSLDGKRLLIDFNTRTTSSRLQHFRDTFRSVATLGMSGEEDVNGEQVRVIDTNTGKSSFSWHHSFASTYGRVRSAAISPSGEFVAIAAGGKLSIYRIPDVCGSAVSVKK